MENIKSDDVSSYIKMIKDGILKASKLMNLLRIVFLTFSLKRIHKLIHQEVIQTWVVLRKMTVSEKVLQVN